MFANVLVDSIAFDKILLKNRVCPLAETYPSVTMYTVTNGYNNIKSIKWNRLFNTINVQKMHVILSWEFCFIKDIVYVSSNV